MDMPGIGVDIERLARLCRALSDETRVRIVLMLTRGEHTVGEMQEALGAYQSRLSFHLKKLREAGVVSDRRSGRQVYYALKPETLRAVRSFLADVEPDAGFRGLGEGRCRCRGW